MTNSQKWTNKMYQQRTQRRPPIAPGKGDLRIYDKFFKETIKNNKRPKVLILGVTPELRDLAFNYSSQVVSVDISKEAIDIFRDMTKTKSKDEVIIQANWLTVPLRKNYFDVVMGDGSFTNLSDLKSQKLLFKKVFELLKVGGYLIMRELVRPQDHKLGLREIIKKYREDETYAFPDFYMDMRFMAYFNNAYNKKHKTISAQIVFKEIEKSFKKGDLNNKEYGELNSLISSVNNVYQKESELKNMFKNYFKLVSSERSSDFHFTKYLPVYCLRRK